MAQSFTFVVRIDNLGAGNIINISLGSGSSWLLGFELQPEPGSYAPVSIQDLSLSSDVLSITAGAAPVNATLVVNVASVSPPYLSGTTVSNDPNCHVKAFPHPGGQTDMMGNWTLNFGY